MRKVAGPSTSVVGSLAYCATSISLIRVITASSTSPTSGGSGTSFMRSYQGVPAALFAEDVVVAFVLAVVMVKPSDGLVVNLGVDSDCRQWRTRLNRMESSTF